MLNDDGQMITLQQEVERVQSYLHIQKLRFDRKIICEMDIQDELMNVAIPPMILLTFVENAIKYNVIQDTPLKIRIDIKQCMGDQIHIMISDDGQGFSAKTIEKINRGEKISERGIEHIGIYNVSARLSLLYNSEGLLRVENNEKGGACIHISLPYQMKGEKINDPSNC